MVLLHSFNYRLDLDASLIDIGLNKGAFRRCEFSVSSVAATITSKVLVKTARDFAQHFISNNKNISLEFYGSILMGDFREQPD